MVFDFKNKLYKQHEPILSNKALNYLEGELNNEEALAFERELALNTELAHEFALFRKTKLSADTSIVFEHKTSLKKEALVIPLYKLRVVFSVAAAIFFVISLSFLLNYYLNPTELPKNSTLLSLDSKKDDISSPFVEKQEETPIHKQSPIAKEKLALKENKNIKTPAPDCHLTNTEDVLAQNTNPIDSTSVLNTNNDNNIALVNDNASKPLTEAEIEGLQKLEYAYMIPFEEEEENETFDDKDKKTNRRFWNFATRLAKKANQLGIKSINGNKDENNHFLLTFIPVKIKKK